MKKSATRCALAWRGLKAVSLTALLLSTAVACKKKNDGGSAGDPDPDPSQDTGVPCNFDSDCNDGAFCNGQESCFEGTCHDGNEPRCDDGIDCTEDKCSHAANNCVFAAPDADGDGFADAKCVGPDDEPLGEDCADDDPDRYPGNPERCSLDAPDHDEDCDPRTFGHLDADLDGVVDARCCNEDDDGEALCGTDCDDEEFHRYPNHAEICDGIDNDCNELVDDDTREVAWYPDEDGDNFGKMVGDAILSCAPIDDHSLRPTDCDDSSPGVHSAAIETCDGFDNNCDGQTDEGGVCACSPDGKAQPCACDGTRTGVQLCDAGVWGACECDECVNGDVDCVAGILPRLCVAGLWEFQTACTGQFSECNAGVCTCPGGGTDCPPLMIYPPGGVPVMISSHPFDSWTPFDPSDIPSVTFSENIDPGTTSGVQLLDAWGIAIAGTVDVVDATVSFTPLSALDSGMAYRLEFPASMADLGGDTLLEPLSFEFVTASGLAPETFTSDPNIRHNRPRLAMSVGGTLIGLFREQTVSPAGERTVVKDYSAGWGASAEVAANWPIDGWELAVDDTGWATAVAYDGANLARYDRQGGGWLAPAITAAASGGGTRNLVTFNGSGRGFYVFENTSMQLELVGRLASGLFDPAITTAMFGDTGRAADIGLNGHGAVATQSTMSLQVWHSEADLANFTIDTLDTSVWNQDVKVGNDGRKYVAYSKNLGSGTPLDQVFVQVFDTTWSGPIDVVGTGNGDELSPQIGVDSTGRSHVAFLKNGRLMTTEMEDGAGAYSNLTEVSRPDSGTPVTNYPVEHFELAVSSGGDAVLVWVQGGGFATDLWSVRYRPGVGWSQPRLLEDLGDPVGLFDVAIDGTGNAHVVFEIVKFDEVDSMTLIVP